MSQYQQMLQQQLEATMLATIKATEDQVDANMKRLDQMGTEEVEEMEILRARRIEQMKKAQARKSFGHGEYNEIGGAGSEKDFFDTAKQSSKLVVHFYRKSTERCAIFDMHFTKLAQMHPEARFVKIDAEKSPFLCEKLRIIMLPTICIVLKGKVADYIVGFDDLGERDDFDTEVLEWRLGQSGVITYTGALEGPIKDTKTHSYIGKGKRATAHGWDDDSDDDF
eukprot:m.186650 g.186650  ORF g.186650 m.186650 type:complete len:224 (+) comp32275_c4_seq5:213-884(+)